MNYFLKVQFYANVHEGNKNVQMTYYIEKYLR